eukprot:GHVR01055871.1.p1 GENE.GHVR01055871.1~~GHVR01055871.1.p1  ORF type:complete len:200 (+),score=66.40 GHVR01055871.1:21-620(+)
MSRAKKKNISKNDFTRSKQRVGRKKLAPTNATRTDFVTKTLTVPQQSVSASRGTVTTSRGHSLTDLFAHLKHHNVNVRKESLLGLKELCERHPQMFKDHLCVILEEIGCTSTDTDNSVRKQQRTLMKWILDNTHTHTLIVFKRHIIANIKSALTHVRNDVRTDGAILLALFLSHTHPHTHTHTHTASGRRGRTITTYCV